ncbi:hypothetical protein BH23GEM9_BH23GEM9_05850 [soil metagenome]
MILYLSFEELAALSAEAERVLDADGTAGRGIAAPPQFLAEVEHFAQLLVGDVNVANLDQQKSMRLVMDHLLHRCRGRMDRQITEQHAAAESAVAAYFDYAHVLSASSRLDRIGAEMMALVQVMTGEDPDSEAGRRFSFPE